MMLDIFLDFINSLLFIVSGSDTIVASTHAIKNMIESSEVLSQ